MPTIKEVSKKMIGKSVDYKMTFAKTLKDSLDKRHRPDGTPMPDNEWKQVAALHSWLMMNIMVGDELCPAESVMNHLK